MGQVSMFTGRMSVEKGCNVSLLFLSPPPVIIIVISYIYWNSTIHWHTASQHNAWH